MFTALFVVSSVSTSTRGLESSLNGALESDGRFVVCTIVVFFNNFEIQLC
jgi:hypothetical protein